MKRVVLAYSGGLNSSVALHRLIEHHGAEVVTVTLDLGQGPELDEARARALAMGAVRAHVLDVADEFARVFVLPAVQAGAIDETGDPLALALAQPLIAAHLVDIARIESATFVAHGYRPADDARSIESSVRILDRSINVVALAREWSFSQAELADYARRQGLPVPPSLTRTYSVAQNLWGRAIERDAAGRSSEPVPEHLYAITRSAAEAPDRPAVVDIAFDRGTPVAINGVTMSLVELIESVQTIAGDHGVGRLGPIVAAPAQRVYEAPAAAVLHAAHAELQRAVMPRKAVVTADLGAKYAELVSNGLWHSSEREKLDAVVAKAQGAVTGTVRLKLSKGRCAVMGLPVVSARAASREPAVMSQS